MRWVFNSVLRSLSSQSYKCTLCSNSTDEYGMAQLNSALDREVSHIVCGLRILAEGPEPCIRELCEGTSYPELEILVKPDRLLI